MGNDQSQHGWLHGETLLLSFTGNVKIEYHRGVLVRPTSAFTFVIAVLVVISVAPNKGFNQVPDGSYVPPQFCFNRLVLTVILVLQNSLLPRKVTSSSSSSKIKFSSAPISCKARHGFPPYCVHYALSPFLSHMLHIFFMSGVANLVLTLHFLTGKLFSGKGLLWIACACSTGFLLLWYSANDFWVTVLN